MQTVAAKTIMQRCKGTSWFGSEYNINLYRGCCHGCIYCDSRSECYHLDDFDTVKAKENCLEILRNELRRKVRTGIIGTGAMSDPYNPYETEQKLTRNALQLIDAYEFGIMTITKSALIKRDTDIYLSIAEHSPVLCQMTITAAEGHISWLVEPNVCPSSERFKALSEMSDRGVFTGIVMTPILPFIEDSEDNILKIVRRAKECGVRSVYPMFGLTIRAGQREYFYRKLEENFPGQGLAERYNKTYGEKYVCNSPDAKRLWYIFTEECRRLGILYEMKDIIAAYKLGYGDRQLTFF